MSVATTAGDLSTRCDLLWTTERFGRGSETETGMAKGQKRSNKETKKPKKAKPSVSAPPSTLTDRLQVSVGQAKKSSR